MTKEDIQARFDSLIGSTNNSFDEVNGEMADVWTAIQQLSAKYAALEAQITLLKDTPEASPKLDSWGYPIPL